MAKSTLILHPKIKIDSQESAFTVFNYRSTTNTCWYFIPIQYCKRRNTSHFVYISLVLECVLRIERINADDVFRVSKRRHFLFISSHNQLNIYFTHVIEFDVISSLTEIVQALLRTRTSEQIVIHFFLNWISGIRCSASDSVHRICKSHMYFKIHGCCGKVSPVCLSIARQVDQGTC